MRAMRSFEPRELAALLAGAAPPLLLDVREPWEWEICRIAGAHLIPMRQIHLAATTFDPEQPLVAFCHHGIRSLQVAHYLERCGFDAANLVGGIDAWARQIDPSMRRY